MMPDFNDIRSLAELAVSGELSFDEVGSEAAEILEAAVDQLFPSQSAPDVIRDVRDYADLQDIPISEALIVKAAAQDNEVGRAVERVLEREALMVYGVDLSAPIPEELRDAVQDSIDYSGRYDDPRYIRLELVSELNPDSHSKISLDVIDGLSSMREEREAAWEDYLKEMDKYTETGHGRFAEAMNDYRHLCDDQMPDIRDLSDTARATMQGPNERLGVDVLNPTERSYVDALLSDREITPMLKSEIELMCPDSPVLELGDAKAALDEACEAYRNDPTTEKMEEAVDRYYEYNDLLEQFRNIDTREWEIEEDYKVQDFRSDFNEEYPDTTAGEDEPDPFADFFKEGEDSWSRYKGVDSFTMPQTGYRGHAGWHVNAETRQEILARENMAKKPWYLSEDVDGNLRKDRISMPFAARGDARAVMDYALAQDIWSHHGDYPTFGEGKDLISSVHTAMDYVEKAAADDLPLSTELKGIVTELETLGPRNGDADHDAKVDELEAKQHDCYLRAGAILAGANDTPDWRDQADAVLEYHRTEQLVNDGSSDPRLPTHQDLGYCRMDLERFNDEGVEGSPARSGPAITYCKYLEAREDADKQLPGLWRELDRAELNSRDRVGLHEADGHLYDAQFASQNAQRMMNRMAVELELCKEGVEVYGIIETPNDVEQGEMVDGGVEPTYMTREEVQAEEVEAKTEPPKTPYEAAKEQYDSIKDKYTFRNVFVSYDRLKLDIEAYKTGENGSRGKPVSGGMIAMDVLELSRGDLGASIIEVAIRTYFDEKYPAVDKAKQVDMEHDDAGTVLVKIDPHDGQVEFGLRYFDDGYVDLDNRNGQRPETNENPDFGRFMGADLTRPSEVDDKDIEVHSCGPRIAMTVTYQSEKGDVETLRIPAIRLVEFKDTERFYLVDPFGRTVGGNVSTSAKNEDTVGKLEHPYFKQLDISASKFGSAAIERYAASRGCTVEEAKEHITHGVMDRYVDRTLANIDKHEPYVREKLLPEAVGQLETVTERLEYLKDIRDSVADHIDNPGAYEDGLRKESYEKLLGRLDSSIDTLTKLEKGLDDRVGKLAGTVDLYRDGKASIAADKSLPLSKVDPTTRFGLAVGVERHSYGKIDNPYYGVSKMDLSSIDKLCSACEFKGKTSDTTLGHEFAARDWPKESQVALDKDGAKVSFFEDRADRPEDKSFFSEWKDRVKDMIPHVEQRYPGLYEQKDVDKFEITDSRFKISDVLREIGALPITRESRDAAAAEARHEAAISKDENADMRRLNMERIIPKDEVGSGSWDLSGVRFIRDLGRDVIPSGDDIRATREEIRGRGEGSVTNEGFGCREKTPDLDWKTVSSDEILRDSDGKHFWMRVEGQGTDFIRVTPEQASGVLKGPLDARDIESAMDKYLELGSNPESTYSFATDFFEDNKYRIDPQSVLDAFANRVEGFLVDGHSKGIEPGSMDIVADCLVSMRDTIVDHFAEKVADKMETIIEKCVSQGSDVERVSAFLDKVEDRMSPLIGSVDALGFDKEDYKATVGVSDVLERLSASGVNDGNVERLSNVINALGTAINGFADVMRDIAGTVDRDAVDRVDKDDDAAVVADAEDEDKMVETPEEKAVADRISREMGRVVDILDTGDSGRFSQDPEDDPSKWGPEEDDWDDDDDEDDFASDLIQLDSGIVDMFDKAYDSFEAAANTLWDIDRYELPEELDRVDAGNADIDAGTSGNAVEAAQTGDDFAKDDGRPNDVATDTGRPDASGEVETAPLDFVEPAQADAGVEQPGVEIDPVDGRNYNDDAADKGDAEARYGDSFDNMGPEDQVDQDDQDETALDDQDQYQDTEQDDFDDTDADETLGGLL